MMVSIKTAIYRATAFAHIVTKHYLAADMARVGEIDFGYVPTAEMVTNCCTKPLQKPTFLKQ
jgi:hypothetical protein